MASLDPLGTEHTFERRARRRKNRLHAQADVQPRNSRDLLRGGQSTMLDPVPMVRVWVRGDGALVCAQNLFDGRIALSVDGHLPAAAMRAVNQVRDFFVRVE